MARAAAIALVALPAAMAIRLSANLTSSAGRCNVGDTVQCPNSPGVFCHGAMCCPATEVEPRSYPCPSAPADYRSCQSFTKVEDCVTGSVDKPQYCKPNDHVRCPGSGVFCYGAQCCPGEGGQDFPCPSAPPGWNKCASTEKKEDCLDPKDSGACTPSGRDPWKSGKHVPCCEGVRERLGDWELNGQWHFRCKAEAEDGEEGEEAEAETSTAEPEATTEAAPSRVRLVLGSRCLVADLAGVPKAAPALSFERLRSSQTKCTAFAVRTTESGQTQFVLEDRCFGLEHQEGAAAKVAAPDSTLEPCGEEGSVDTWEADENGVFCPVTAAGDRLKLCVTPEAADE